MNRRTALYRLHDAEGVLLYVGISSDPELRFRQHAMEKRWWHEVARRTIEWFSTRAAAEAAEETAIKIKRPKYNVVHSNRKPVPVTAIVSADFLPGLDVLTRETAKWFPGFSRGDMLVDLLVRELRSRGLCGEPPCLALRTVWLARGRHGAKRHLRLRPTNHAQRRGSLGCVRHEW